MFQQIKWLTIVSLLTVLSMIATACAPPTPEVIEKEVVVEKPVVETVVVEKPVVQTVVVEKVVTATPVPKVSEIVIAHPGPIYTMDAPVTWYGSTHYLTMMLYDCMIWRAPDMKGYVPQLAESWENIEPDRWRFKIRENATFHNGEPIDAETIKWNIDRVRTREDFMVQGQWQFVKDVEIVDKYTLDIVTDSPRAYLEYDVSFNGCEILPPGYIQEVGEEEFAKHPVGSGPYKLVEFIEGERYVFEAWDDYWGGRPEIDRVIYQVIPESASRVAGLLAGQVDYVGAVPLPDRARIEAAEGLKLVKGPANLEHQLILRDEIEHGSVAKDHPGWFPTTANKQIRQAISHALDRTVLAEVQGSAVPTLAYLLSVWPEVPADKYVGADKADAWYDPELARDLIKQAGYDPDAGNKPLLYFDASDPENMKEVAEVVKVMLEDVGFEVEMKIWDEASYTEKIQRPGGNRDVYMVRTAKGPTILLMQYDCSWTGPNYVCRPELDKLNKAIIAEMDPEKRIALWEKWWEWYVDDAITISMYEITDSIGMNECLEWTPRADFWVTPRDARWVCK